MALNLANPRGDAIIEQDAINIMLPKPPSPHVSTLQAPNMAHISQARLTSLLWSCKRPNDTSKIHITATQPSISLLPPGSDHDAQIAVGKSHQSPYLELKPTFLEVVNPLVRAFQ